MELLREQTDGLTKRIAQLRATERIMLEAMGLKKNIAREKKAIAELGDKVQAAKEALCELQAEQARLVSEAAQGFLSRMEEALPEGRPSLKIADDRVELGWVITGTLRPFRSLSGGERVAFDMALAYALGAGLIIKECAELDPSRLNLVLDRFRDNPAQVVVVTCHRPERRPVEWEHLSL